MGTSKKRKKKGKQAGTVPRRQKGEALTAYHDRLAALAAETQLAGDHELSTRLQQKAGKIAAEHGQVARKPREGKRSGPGTYPWYQCVEEQKRRARGEMGPAEAQERANKICGRIRATSRSTYPAYWSSREKTSNPADVGVPFAAIVIDGGPRAQPHRDIAVVVDRGGTILDIHPILSDHSMRELDSKYPELPLFGPFQVLASNIREIYRAAEQGTPHVQVR